MIQTSLSETQGSVNLGNLAKNSVVILSIQAVGFVLTYLAQISLARWMGRTEYGVYEYVISWSLVLAIPVGLGLPRAVLRFISEYRVRQEWSELRGLLLSSWQITAGVGLLLSLGSMEIISFLNRNDSLLYAPVLLVGVWLIPLQALIQLQEDMARGADSILLAYGPSKVIGPLLILVGGFLLFNYNHDLTSIPMIRMASVALLVVVVFQMICLWFKFDGEIGEVKSIYRPRKWLFVALPLLLDRGFQTLLEQTDILMLGSLMGAGSVSIYSAGAKTAILTNFVLQSLNLVAAPAYAILYAQGDRPGLQKVVSRVTLWIFAPSVLIAAILAIFAQPILSVFGPEFLEAQWALRVLIIGQLVDVLCGSVGYLMMMTGHQNKSVIVSASCAFINLGLNTVLIPRFGVLGAAIATTSTLVIWNVWLCFAVIQNIHVNPSILYSLKEILQNSSEKS
jgi:O-antigen/teichoic acid export membrane protein